MNRVMVGARLRAAREERGWSRLQLAARFRAASRDSLPSVDSLKHMIKEWERGKHLPDERYQELYARVLGVNLASVDFESDGVDHERVMAAVERPALLDRPVVDSLAMVLGAQRRLEDTVGSAAMLDAASGHLRLVTRLLRDGRPSDDVARRLAVVGSDASHFVGWLNAATGAHTAAGPMYDQSLRLGLRAGDQELAATALSMRGHLAWVTGDLREMADLSRAAGELAGSAATRATAAQQEGRAHSLMGDRRAALRAMGQAEDALAEGRNSADAPDLLYFHGPGLLLAQRGLILAYLAGTPAEHAEAADTIMQGVNSLPPEIRDSGWLAWYRVQAARARALSGEPAEGAGQLRTVLQLAISDKTRVEVSELHRSMGNRWPDDEAVNELGQQLL